MQFLCQKIEFASEYFSFPLICKILTFFNIYLPIIMWQLDAFTIFISVVVNLGSLSSKKVLMILNKN